MNEPLKRCFVISAEDKELQAIEICIAVLNELNASEKCRTINYLSDRFLGEDQ